MKKLSFDTSGLTPALKRLLEIAKAPTRYGLYASGGGVNLADLARDAERELAQTFSNNRPN